MSHRFRALLLATSALVPLSAQIANANPLGAQVVGGAATIAGQGTANVTVTQTSQDAIINWQTFNIGAGETTQFVQPNANSVVLDRVTGGLRPSTIYGTLTSNGEVFLVNPDGVLIGPTGKINTSSFLATTHDISNADLMAGKYNFGLSGSATASVVNEGSITAQSGGFAALVAPGVRNTGTITATLGTVALASGNTFSLDFYGDQLIKLGVNDSIAAQVIDVSTGKPLASLVSNEGTLKADGGRVELTAVAARAVVDSVINNSGGIEANTIGKHNGMIMLGAATAGNKPAGAPTQLVKVSGKLSATGNKKGTTGGTIVVSGESIQLANATIDASGQAGGGKVLIGGDTGGGNSNPAVAGISEAALESFAVPTASTVSIDAATTIDASAVNSGNGGKVIVWADGTTSVAGSIVARGGAISGNGGFVETSGHDKLAFNGSVNVGAAYGVSGTWLLDPQDVTIASSGGAWVVTPTSIENALASGNVLVETLTTGSGNGDITVADSVSWSGDYSLTLIAARNITVNNGVTIANTGAGNLTLFADYAGTYNGTFNGTGTDGANIGSVYFVGSGKVDFSQSTGYVSIFYYPQLGYAHPNNYSSDVLNNTNVPNQMDAYILINNLTDQENAELESPPGGDYGVTFLSPTTFQPFNTVLTGQPVSLPTATDTFGTGQVTNLTTPINTTTAGTQGAQTGPSSYSVLEATVDGRTFTPISQLDTSLYGGDTAALSDTTQTCLATVYTMIARADGDPSATIGQFWNPELGAVDSALPNNVKIGSPAIAINYNTVASLLESGNPVILEGSTPYSGGTEAHYMLATALLANGDIVANDPWTGEQVIISPVTGRVIEQQPYALPNFTITEYKTVTITS
jgi:filamentous hemagglutinin family protein